MIERKPEIIRYMIVDFDECALFIHRDSLATRFISPGLISHIQKMNTTKRGYYGFYGCTARSLNTLEPNVTARISNLLISQFNESDLQSLIKNPDNVFTKNVPLNLATQTGLPCVGISTPDDEKNVGDSFSILEQMEEEILLTYKSHHNLNDKNCHTVMKDACRKWSKAPEFKDPIQKSKALELQESEKNKRIDAEGLEQWLDSKNKQLIQIAWNAYQKSPGKNISLDYFDDRLDLLDGRKDQLNRDVLHRPVGALQIKPADLPPGVTLNIYHHKPRDHGHTIAHKGFVKGSPIPQKGSLLKTIGWGLLGLATVLAAVALAAVALPLLTPFVTPAGAAGIAGGIMFMGVTAGLGCFNGAKKEYDRYRAYTDRIHKIETSTANISPSDTEITPSSIRSSLMTSAVLSHRFSNGSTTSQSSRSVRSDSFSQTAQDKDFDSASLASSCSPLRDSTASPLGETLEELEDDSAFRPHSLP